MIKTGANEKEATTTTRHSTPNLSMNTHAKARADRLQELAKIVNGMTESSEECALSVLEAVAGA